LCCWVLAAAKMGCGLKRCGSAPAAALIVE
jgi:hypothetical protein